MQGMHLHKELMKATYILAPVTHTTAPHHTTHRDCYMGGGEGETPQENGNYILGVRPRQSSVKSSSTQLPNGSHPVTFREGTVVTGNSFTQHLAAVNPTTCYSPGTHQLEWKGEPNSSEMVLLIGFG